MEKVLGHCFTSIKNRSSGVDCNHIFWFFMPVYVRLECTVCVFLMSYNWCIVLIVNCNVNLLYWLSSEVVLIFPSNFDIKVLISRSLNLKLLLRNLILGLWLNLLLNIVLYYVMVANACQLLVSILPLNILLTNFFSVQKD
jgi:hypothetical protein